MLPLDTGTRVSAFQGLALGEEVALKLCPQALRRPQGWAGVGSLDGGMKQESPPPLPPESPLIAGCRTAPGPTTHPARSLPHLGVPEKSGRRILGSQCPQLSQLLGEGVSEMAQNACPQPRR